ncbi:MAG: DDE-type integrase/transposase/recombinase [Candidatus Peribacteraceae bacterium]|nr:DDE-type integrase/transposase/recombinase [Candidatus Peribacteraceae bacterium]
MMQNVYDNEVVQYRLKYVLEVKHGDKSISQAARDAQVDWKTMKSWIIRFEMGGIKGLVNKPRGNSKPVDEDVKSIIVDMKRENPHRSARRVRDLLRQNENVSLHRQTIWRALKNAGENKRAKKKVKVFRDFERVHPNSLWQVDFMDAIVIEGIGLVFLVLFIDDHSRKIVGARFVKNRESIHVLQLLWETIERYGIPSQIYSDQGKQFRSHLGRGYSHYEKVCNRLGIDVIHGTPRYPQGRGKIERLFGFVQDDFITEYRFKDLEDMNGKFDNWTKWYGEEHEHSALGGKPPNSRYTDFIPRMPEGDLFEIFSEHFDRMVRKNATISFKGNIYPVDPRHIRDYVEVRAFGHIVKIYAQSRLLGEYDSRINYHEKMLRQSHHRLVKKDGQIKFRKNKYLIGKEFVGQKVEIVVIRDQLRAFLSSNRLVIFKMGECDAVVVRLDR